MNKSAQKYGMFFALFAMMMVGFSITFTNAAELSYVKASVANVQDGSYPVARELYLYTDGDLAAGSLADDFIKFLLGEDGQYIVANESFVPLTPAAYTYSSPAQTTLEIEGSTTCFPIVQAAAENYTAQHAGKTITVTGTGSGTGIEQLIAGNVEVAMASRAMKDSEKAELPNWVEYVIAKDGIAIVVNTENTIEQLTMRELKMIYNGTISNWKEVGGSDAPIACINRESTSGTRDFFYENVMDKEDFRSDDQISEKNSNGAVATEVEGNPNAIGYVGLGYMEGKKVLAIADSDTTPNYDAASAGGIDGFSLFPIVSALGIIAAAMIYKKKRA